MRARLLALSLVAALSGCVVSRKEHQAVLHALDVQREENAAHRARLEALEHQLSDVVVEVDELRAEKMLLQDRSLALEEALTQAEAAEREFRELNAHLLARERAQVRLTAEESSVWFSTALDRARRTLPVATPREDAEPAPAAEVSKD